MLLQSLHLPLITFLVFIHFAHATLVNVTVDDQEINVSGVNFGYDPPTRWIAQGSDNSTAPPPSSRANNGTWTFCSWDPNTDTDFPILTLNFTGTAINLFGILQRNVLTAVDVGINGSRVSRYSQTLVQGDPFAFNVSLFSNFSLPPGEHILTLSPVSEDPSVIYFDYLIFTPVFSAASPDVVMMPFPSGVASPSVASTAFPALVPLPEESTTELSTPAETPATSTSPPAPLETPTSASYFFSIPPSVTPSSVAPSAITPATPTVDYSNQGSSSGPNQSTIPKSTLWAIIGSAAGGAILLFLLLVLCLVRRHRRMAPPTLKVTPFLDPSDAPLPSPNSAEIGKAPASASSLTPFFAVSAPSPRSSYSNPSPTITLSSEFPTSSLTSELEDVFRQLEDISYEVESLQGRTNMVQESLRASSVVEPPPVLPLEVHRSIDQIRSEVERLRRQSAGTSLNHGAGGVRTTVMAADMVAMLQDLALLRAEVEEMLADQIRGEEGNERLSSYHSSRRNSPSFPSVSPPPMPAIPPQVALVSRWR